MELYLNIIPEIRVWLTSRYTTYKGLNNNLL